MSDPLVPAGVADPAAFRALYDAGINIDDMHLGRSPRGEAALQVLATDRSVPTEVQDVIRAGAGIVSVHAIS